MIISKLKSVSISIILLSLVISCTSQHPDPALSFYYWRTDFGLKANERAVLSEHKVARLYVRYFDIVFDNNLQKAIPVGIINFRDTINTAKIVPVVFIKNNVFEVLDSAAIDSLAENAASLIHQINNSVHLTADEVQIDCDWNSKTALKYFYFLRATKKAITNKSSFNTPIITATIRLHQIKYAARQGVPPVDKGVLMCYNMGKINNGVSNSIYDPKISLSYLPALKKYPLSLDFALPIFAWGIHLRQGVVIELLNKMDTRDFQDKNEFYAVSEARYQAVNSFFKKGFYFKKGDEIKVEEVSSEQLKRLVADLQKNYDRPVGQIICYDLDSFNISRYEKDIFKKMVAGF